MTARRTARLRLTPGGIPSAIEVDGQHVPGVRRVVIDAQAGQVPTLTLDLRVHQIDLDGVVSVVVPDRTRQALITLGWTPPGGAAGTADHPPTETENDDPPSR